MSKFLKRLSLATLTIALALATFASCGTPKDSLKEADDYIGEIYSGIATLPVTLPDAIPDNIPATLPDNIPEILPPLPVTTEEPPLIVSGTCGPSSTWLLEENLLTISGTGTVEYIKGSITKSSHAPWEEYKNYIEYAVIEEGITEIQNYVFWFHKNLKSVSLPNSLERLDGAFRYCTSLEEITIPENVVWIYANAFEGCSSLKIAYYNAANAYYKYSATSDEGMFVDCPDLETIVIGNKVESIPETAFAHSDIKTLTIPSNVKKIDTKTDTGVPPFFGCDKLHTVTFEEGCTFDDEVFDAFSGFNAIETFNIPSTMTNIKKLQGSPKVFNAYFNNLKYINVSEDNPVLSDYDGILTNKEQTMIIFTPATRIGENITLPSAQ